MSSLIELCWIILPMKATSHLWGVDTVSPKWRLIKCSSMKSGVFPFTLDSPDWGVEGISCIPTQSVAQCMNCYPWTTAVTPCWWNLHTLPADPRGVKLTESNSWWHIDHTYLENYQLKFPKFLQELLARKSGRNYQATKTMGQAVRLVTAKSEIHLDVAEGVNAVTAQYIYTSFKPASIVIPRDECIISPVVRFNVQEDENNNSSVSPEFKFKVTIPHCLTDDSPVKVRCGNILESKRSLRKVPKGPQDGTRTPYYTVDERHITLYTNHFCDIVCTSAKKVYNSSLLILPFGSLEQDLEGQTHAKVKVFLCNLLFNLTEYRLARSFLIFNPSFKTL